LERNFTTSLVDAGDCDEGHDDYSTCGLASFYIKRDKVSVRTSVMLGMASSVANDVIMRIACFVAAGTGRRYGDWRHDPASVADDVIMRIAGLVVGCECRRREQCSSNIEL